MENQDKIYSVNINGKERGFFIDYKDDGRIFLVIPDYLGPGGMIPIYPDQLPWLEEKLPPLRNLNRVWNTI